MVAALHDARVRTRTTTTTAPVVVENQARSLHSNVRIPPPALIVG